MRRAPAQRGAVARAQRRRAGGGGARRVGAAPDRLSPSDRRPADRVVDRVDVAASAALVLTNAMVNQETGVRGYVLGGDEAFLEPYHAGVAEPAARCASSTRSRGAEDARPTCARDLAAARRAIDAWRDRLRAADDRARSAGSAPAASRTPPSPRARRASTPCAPRSRACRPTCAADRADARADLASAATTLTRALIFAAVLLLGRAAGRRGDRPPGHRGARSGGWPTGARRRRRRRCSRAIEPGGPRDIERARRGRRGDARADRARARGRARRRGRARGAGRSRSSARTPSSSSSPTSPRTTSRSRCARSRASASCSSAATRASSTSAASSTSPSPSTAPSACRS